MKKRSLSRLSLAVGLGVLLVALLGATLRYAGVGNADRYQYLATERIRIGVEPAGTPTQTELALAQQAGEALVRALSASGLHANGLDTAVATRLQSSGGVKALGRVVSPREAGAALTATHETRGATAGALVALAARWRSAAGALALVTATVEALRSAPDLGRLRALVAQNVVSEPAGLSDATVQLIAESEPAATLDPAVEAAARANLLARSLFGVVAGLLTLWVAEALTRRAGQGRQKGRQIGHNTTPRPTRSTLAEEQIGRGERA